MDFRGGGASCNSLSVRKIGLISSNAPNNNKRNNILLGNKEGFWKIKGFTLAEVLITLGILGVVIVMILPGVMSNYEKKLNAVILKRAYSDLLNYIAMFAYEKDCPTSLSDCTPNDGQFVWEFSEYLYKKQNFQEFSGYCKRKPNCTEFIGHRKNSSSNATTVGFFYTVTTPNKSGYYLKSPTGLYAYHISYYMYDNYYNIKGDTFRARILIMTDMNNNGVFPKGFSVAANPRANIPQYGKNLFEAYVLNSKKLIPNGYSLCQNNYYCGTLGKYKFCGENGDYSACLQRVMNDGWEIKYNY